MKKLIIFESLIICLLMLLIPISSSIEIQLTNKIDDNKISDVDSNSLKLNSNDKIVQSKKSTHVIIPCDGDKDFYALIAGCSKYEDSWNNLPRPPLKPFPESTMKYVYDVLIDSSNWDEDNIILLLNEEATRQNIVDNLAYMGSIIDGDDIFLFSWTGHGTQVDDLDGDDGDGFDEAICPYDTTKNKNGELLNILTDDELDSYFSLIGAEGLFLMFESCFSGGLVDVEIQQGFSFVDVDDDRRVVVMSTLPDKSGFGMFDIGWPMLMLYGMAFSDNSCDTNLDGWISAEEAFTFVDETYPIIENNFYMSLLNFSIKLSVIIVFLNTYKFLKKLGVDLGLRIVLSTLVTGYAYIIYQNDSFKKLMMEYMEMLHEIYGLENNPNMCDDYLGELNIIKIE